MTENLPLIRQETERLGSCCRAAGTLSGAANADMEGAVRLLERRQDCGPDADCLRRYGKEPAGDAPSEGVAQKPRPVIRRTVVFAM